MIVSEHDPFRTPDWRFRRAAWLVDQGRYARTGVDDEFVKVAKNFIRTWEHTAAADNHTAAERLARKYPGVYYARAIHGREDVDDRWVIQARILANQPRQEIAERQFTTAETILWYEKLYFDVRDKLHRKDWVINRVLGPAIHRGVRARDFDMLLKLYALCGGSLIVDNMVEAGINVLPRPTKISEIAGFWMADKNASLARQAALSVRCTPLLPETQGFILDAHHKIAEMERSAATGSVDALAKGVQAVLECLPFRIAATVEQGAAPQALEPRAGEMLGGEAPAGASLFTGFSIPEANNGDSAA